MLGLRVVADLVLVVVVSVGCWGGGYFCLTQNKKKGYEPNMMPICLVACAMYWCRCVWCMFIPFICKDEKCATTNIRPASCANDFSQLDSDSYQCST